MLIAAFHQAIPSVFGEGLEDVGLLVATLGRPLGCEHAIDHPAWRRGEEDVLRFTDHSIHQLFGNEAAENESIERLREYYVKSDVFDMMTGDAPLRIRIRLPG